MNQTSVVTPTPTGIILTTGDELACLLSKMLPSIIEDGIRKIKQEELQEKLYTPEEARKLLKCSRATIDNWSANGKLVKLNIAGRVYFKHADIMNALQSIKKYSRR